MTFRVPLEGLQKPLQKWWFLTLFLFISATPISKMEETSATNKQYHQQQRSSSSSSSSNFGNNFGSGSSDESSSAQSNGNDDIQCPSFAENSACPCYKFDDGLFLECPGTTAASLRSILQLISSPIQSLSVYDFDRSVTSLSQDLFSTNGVHIRHLQFSHSHLQMLKDNSLQSLRATLESLSIVNGKLTQIPQKALTGMQKLMVLDFESNEITDIVDYCFYGLHLVKLNLKGNLIETIPENAFAGLGDSIAEIDVSENRVKHFPMFALRKLDFLRSLRLSLNEISTLLWDGASRLDSLTFLDISSNYFEEISDNFFRPFPLVKTISLYNNLIEQIHKNAFSSLRDLQSLDISHNKIIYLDPATFQYNKKLHTIDLSHNHIHYISGVFSNLPTLHEVFLSDNNILELTNDAFANSTKISVIYLETNSIKRIDSEVLSTLRNLEQLYLSSNFIPYIPSTLFDRTTRLTSLSLDDNWITEIEKGTFSKLENLREIRLHNNRIENIKRNVFAPLPGLLELHLQYNRIKSIENGAFLTLVSLQHINLQGNFIPDMKMVFSHNTSSLLSIQLDSNNITEFQNTSFRGQSSVRIMWFGNNQLKKLERSIFKDLVRVEKLYLTRNQIVKIDTDTFQPMKLLKFLDLSFNRLRYISSSTFEHLHEVEELNLSENQIEQIDARSFKKLKKLKVLDLSNNNLKKLHRDIFQDDLPVQVINLRNSSLIKIEPGVFNGMNNLNELNMESNKLTSVDIKQLDIPSLRVLKISQNNFSDLNNYQIGGGGGGGGGNNPNNIFDKLPSLQILILENCSITDLNEKIFLKTTNLVRIDLGSNQLKTIDRNVFNGLNVFKELRLTRNLINDYPHIALNNISTLETLSLAGNLLTNLDFYKLNGLPNLRNLDLKDNTLSSLSGFNAVNLTQLDYVDLSGNILSSLPTNFFQNSVALQRVDLALNRFKQIPTSALSDNSLARLSWLNLTGNPLNQIYFDEHNYPYLKELHISQTNLTILTSKDFTAFPALQHLYLVQNRINRVSPGAFINLDNLVTLDLSVNELEILPKERLQGLKLLRYLNVSHNNLKELDEFAADLTALEILDLSYNQFDRIGKNTLKNLIGLTELYVMGNRITVISADGFKNLRKLKFLDLRRNYFEHIPIRSLKLIETHIKTLRLEDNPLICSCDSQELWEWLRDHQKWAIDGNGLSLRCEQPSEVRGRQLLEMEPKAFCDAPLIIKLAIQDIQPFSVLVSWQGREHSGIVGYQVVYHALDSLEEIRVKVLNRSANSAKLNRLDASTRYMICVVGLGNWISNSIDQPGSLAHTVQESSDESLPGDLDSLIADVSISRCTEVSTLDTTAHLMTDESGLASQGFIHSILTRRLGLIVGCCLGIIVFIVLISVLGWLKIKKQRLDNTTKRQQPPVPPEYISYRHFSIPHDEHNRLDGCPPTNGGHHGLHGTTLLNS